ncbi:MAG: nucleotide exchange factor GrpE [Actinomycetota bacterium]|nr:nucleotide exchange factor GrpE [Actinomycetota bacterium]
MREEDEGRHPDPPSMGGEVGPQDSEQAGGPHRDEADPEGAASAPSEEPSAAEDFTDELDEARRQAASHLEDLRRVAADFENYRKRMVREQTQHVERASQRVVSGLLPVLDSFDLALAHEPTSPSEQKLLEGMHRTHQLLMDTLSREGLEPVGAVGEAFDPELHEAVATAEGGASQELPVVVEELRRGYRLRGRVIRPALVSVGAAAAPEGTPDDEQER